MELKKPFKFLLTLPEKLNRYFQKRAGKTLIIKNKKKNKFDPVTNFDKLFEAYIRSLIIKEFPKDSIIGEEFKDMNLLNDYKWSIDPIDGTKVFVIGAPTWSNLVGLSFNQKAVLGLANFPELNKFYISDEKKSYLYKKKNKKILRSSKNHNLSKIKIIGNFHKSLPSNKEDSIIKKFGSRFQLASFDALNYCLLAEGKVDAVIEDNLKIYDILPLIPIMKNAGAIVSTWKNEPAEKGGNIVASSNKKLHNKILRLLKNY